MNRLKALPQWTLTTGSLITLVISILILIPVYLNQLIPLNDYPFHLARIIILSDLNNPVYSEFYKLGSLLLPNMAMDMFAIPLASIMHAETASRIFVMLSLLSMLFGTMMLHKAAHKRFSPWPLLASALLFNGIFRYGFLNYIFGMGIAFFAAGLWLTIKPSNLRLFFTFVASCVLVLLHFEAFAVFAVIVGSIEIYYVIFQPQKEGIKYKAIQLIISACPFLLTITLFILISPTAEVASQGFHYPNYLGAKPYGAIYSLLTGINWLDIICFSSLVIATIFLFFTKRIQLSSPLLLAALMMSIAFMVLPSSIMGSSFVYVRLGPAIALLFIATIDVKPNCLNTNSLIACLALILAIFTSISITQQWQDFNKTTSNIIRVFDKTEPGAIIFNATTQPFTHLIADTPKERAAWNPPLKHIASYAVLYGPKFVPMTFADLTKQPLNVASKYQKIKDFQGDNPRQTVTSTDLEKFLFEIKGHMVNKDWPVLKNVYVFVMGFDRIKESFNLSILEDWAEVTELNDDHILIKLKPYSKHS